LCSTLRFFCGLTGGAQSYWLTNITIANGRDGPSELATIDNWQPATLPSLGGF
jgi:hypothetical protein